MVCSEAIGEEPTSVPAEEGWHRRRRCVKARLEIAELLRKKSTDENEWRLYFVRYFGETGGKPSDMGEPEMITVLRLISRLKLSSK